MIVGDKVSARIPQNGHLDLLQQLQHVCAKAILIGEGMAGIVHAAVNIAEGVLHKVAEKQGADLPLYFFTVDGNFCFHQIISPSRLV